MVKFFNIVFLLVVLGCANSQTLTVNTYDQLQVYTMSSENSLLTGNGQELSLMASVDIDAAEITLAVNIGDGSLFTYPSRAIGEDGSFYTILRNFNVSNLAKINPKLIVEESFTLNPQTNNGTFACDFLDLVNTTLSCFIGTNIYQLDVTETGRVSYIRTVSLNIDLTNAYIGTWVKSAAGGFVGYGATNGYPMLIVSIDNDFKVTDAWTFGNLQFGDAIDMVEVQGLPGVFAVSGLTQSDGGFVGTIDLHSTNPINNYAFYTFEATPETNVRLSSTVDSNFVLYTQDTVSFFAAFRGGESFSASWSILLSSSLGSYTASGIQTQSNKNLLVSAIVGEHSVGEDIKVGSIQLVEVDYKKGHIGSSPNVQAQPSDLNFQIVQYWYRGGAPTNVKTQVAVETNQESPWSSIEGTTLSTKTLPF
mmetsp:Transcript_32486/g.36844  ORF Transcript_32486/g.36844 Transcript_32486/m.36844 type:complete len:421 (-) Transcript_32486:75-1337(-)